jgi:undecaprenyl-diphosphatase
LAGAVQGIAEFLPISSSGHLILFHNILNFNLPDNMLFDVVLHLGTVLALILVFYKKIWQLLSAWFAGIFSPAKRAAKNYKLGWMVIIGVIPAGLAGYLLGEGLEKSRYAVEIVASALIIIGLLFFVAEKYAKQDKELVSVGFWGALRIGCAQAVALIPGVSRSGITIISGLASGLKREEAAEFSFLLSIPVILGAGLKTLHDALALPGGISDSGLLLVGFLTAVVTGYVAIRFLLKYLSNHSLAVFAWYRIILGLAIFSWLIFRGW